MSNSNRPLLPQFLEFMRSHKAWPPQIKVETWLQSIDEGMRHGVYSQMIRGVPVDPECVVKVVRYLLADTGTSVHSHAAATFKAYLKTRGIESTDGHSEWSLAERLLESPTIDHLERGFRGILDALRSRRIVDRFVQACANEQMVRDAVHWMYVWVGRHLEHIAPPSTIAEAITAAEQHMQISMEAYQAKATAWWDFDRWTVILVRGKRTATGMNIVLPLRRHVYDSIRNGERKSYDVEPSDLQRPSRYILHEGTAERPPDLGGNDGNTTRGTLIGILSQDAVLSHDNHNFAKTPVHVLTFGGTEKNLRRAQSFGFKPTGATMPGTKIVMTEKILEWPFHRDDVLFAAGLTLLGMHADEMLAPPYDKNVT